MNKRVYISVDDSGSIFLLPYYLNMYYDNNIDYIMLTDNETKSVEKFHIHELILNQENILETIILRDDKLLKKTMKEIARYFCYKFNLPLKREERTEIVNQILKQETNNKMLKYDIITDHDIAEDLPIDYSIIEQRDPYSFKPGQLIVIKLPGLMDNDLITKETANKNNWIHRKIKQEIQNHLDKTSRTPAIILQKHISGSGSLPSYDVGFWTRFRTGELSSLLVLKNIPIWKYLSGDIVPEGTPPNWIIDFMQGGLKDYYILPEDICYVKPGECKTGWEDYFYYPYRGSLLEAYEVQETSNNGDENEKHL